MKNSIPLEQNLKQRFWLPLPIASPHSLKPLIAFLIDCRIFLFTFQILETIYLYRQFIHPCDRPKHCGLSSNQNYCFGQRKPYTIFIWKGLVMNKKNIFSFCFAGPTTFKYFALTCLILMCMHGLKNHRHMQFFLMLQHIIVVWLQILFSTLPFVSVKIKIAE